MNKLFNLINELSHVKIVNQLRQLDSNNLSSYLTLIDTMKQLSPIINSSVLSIKQKEEDFTIKIFDPELKQQDESTLQFLSLNEFLGMTVCKKTQDIFDKETIVAILIQKLFNESDIFTVQFNHKDILEEFIKLNDHQLHKHHIDDFDRESIIAYIENKIDN